MRLLLLCGVVFHSAYGATATVNVLSTFSVPTSTGSPVAHAINNNGVVVGKYTDASGTTHGFIYTGGAVSKLDYPGALRTEALGVNDSGVVVGCYYFFVPTACYNAFEYKGGAYADISYPGEFIAPANGLNNLNQVVGSYYSPPNEEGYLRSAAGQYLQFQYPGSLSTYAYGINNAGLVIGVGTRRIPPYMASCMME